MAKRKIFDELIEGVDAMKKHREGKLTLRSYKEEVTSLPAVDSKFIREARKRMRVRERCSHASCGSTREPWRNGSRGGPSRILRGQRWFCWCAGIPTRLSGWKRWRRVEAVPMKQRTQTRKRRLGQPADHHEVEPSAQLGFLVFATEMARASSEAIKFSKLNSGAGSR